MAAKQPDGGCLNEKGKSDEGKILQPPDKVGGGGCSVSWWGALLRSQRGKERKDRPSEKKSI